MAETADGEPLHHKMGVFSMPESDYVYEFNGTEDDWVRIQMAIMNAQFGEADDET